LEKVEEGEEVPLHREFQKAKQKEKNQKISQLFPLLGFTHPSA
jgi:hypothetical protein